MTEKSFKLGDLSNGEPDLDYLLDCLSTLNPNHTFFRRYYVAPPVKRKEKEDKILEGLDEFFAGLPDPATLRINNPSLKAFNRLIKTQ
jgi:hypothetical protein